VLVCACESWDASTRERGREGERERGREGDWATGRLGGWSRMGGMGGICTSVPPFLHPVAISYLS
jgi:hypothetical protein